MVIQKLKDELSGALVKIKELSEKADALETTASEVAEAIEDGKKELAKAAEDVNTAISNIGNVDLNEAEENASDAYNQAGDLQKELSNLQETVEAALVELCKLGKTEAELALEAAENQRDEAKVAKAISFQALKDELDAWARNDTEQNRHMRDNAQRRYRQASLALNKAERDLIDARKHVVDEKEAKKAEASSQGEGGPSNQSHQAVPTA